LNFLKEFFFAFEIDDEEIKPEDDFKVRARVLANNYGVVTPERSGLLVVLQMLYQTSSLMPLREYNF
jgi:hypothetical protein